MAGRDALEAGDEDDLALVERLVDPLRADLDDLRLRVRRVGDDPRLRAGQRDRLVAEVLDRHLGQRARDALADGDQHVHRARLRPVGDPVRQVDELVGRVAHRREHGDDAAALLLRGDDPARDVQQPLGVADGRAAELHHERADARRVVAGNRRNGLVVGGGHVARKGTRPKTATKNAEPADPKANRFDSEESNVGRSE